MKIEYALTPDDWAVFGEYHARNTSQFRRVKNRAMAGGILFALGIGAALSSLAHTAVWLLIGIVLAAVWAWYWPRQFVANARAYMVRRDRACLSGSHMMEALPEGLRAKCDITDSTIAWIGIREVIETADYVFVMLDALQGYVVPKQRLTAGDVGQFLREVNRLRALL